jgi:dolichyl-diphosphooligosaccharide--protein glycosyltransferase
MMSTSKKKRGKAKAQVQKPPTSPPPDAGPAPGRTAAVIDGEKPVDGKATGLASYLKAPSAPVLILLGVLAVALIVRLLPLLYCCRDGHLLFVEPDSYYHLRRITYIVQHFPGVNIFDSYVNYPQGYFIGWPPLFDLAAAAAALVAGLGHPGQLAIEASASVVNVGIGLLGIVAAFYLAKDMLGTRAALPGAFVMAILPATASVAIFGYVGHHSLEMLVSLTMYLLFLRSVTGGKATGLTFSSVRSRKRPVVYAALAGLAVAAAVFAWDGAPYFIGILVLYAFALYVWNARRGESSEYLTVAGVIAAVTALALVAPFAVTSYYGQRLVITAIYLSWFHVIMLAALAAFFVFMGTLDAATKKARAPWFAMPAIALFAAGALLIAVRELVPPLFENLVAGMTFLSGGTTVLSSISEVSPLLSQNGQFSLVLVWTYLGTALLIAVPGLLAYLYCLRKTDLGPAEIFFLLWTAVIVIMSLFQARFIYLLGINVAMLAGYGICRLAEAAGLDRSLAANSAAGGSVKRSPAKRRMRIPAGLAGGAVVIALLLLQPLASSYVIATTPLPATANWDDAARWLKDHTPATSATYSADLGTMPEYGVMTWWDYGNYILYRGERPAVANNFQTGVDDAARFFVAPDESAADGIMEKRQAKYVLVDYIMRSSRSGAPGGPGIFEYIATLAGDDISTYFMDYRRLDPTSGGTMAYVDGNAKYYGTMYSRLYNDRGLGGRDPLGNVTSGLQHYRLVYANSGTDPVLIFERVAGATIEGSAPAGQKVELRLDVTDGTTDGTYYSRTTADQGGAYRFTVPYATGVAVGTVKTGEYYVISSGGAQVEVVVTEDTVQGGKLVNAGGMP